MVDLQSWMKEIGDDTSIAKLTIPGTHNSGACYTALPSVQCQGEYVTDQLKHGVRFLDVRAGKLFMKEGEEAKDLQVIHGKFPVKIPFPEKLSSVMKEVYEFLEENPSETVLFSLKQEGIDDWNNDQDEFGNCIWDRYIDKNKDKWYLGTDLPKLRDCRGKVILFRRFGVCDENRAREFGFNASSWHYNTVEDDRGDFVVQDFCEINEPSDIEKKLGYVKELAKKAFDYNRDNDNKLYVNFSSGANFFNTSCWPEKVADGMIAGNISECFNKAIGIVVLDYIEKDNWRLARELVEKNFN